MSEERKLSRVEERMKAGYDYVHRRVYEDDCGRTGDVYAPFIEGAEWADDTMIEKAVNWLQENLMTSDLDRRSYNVLTEEGKQGLIEDFKQSMEA